MNDLSSADSTRPRGFSRLWTPILLLVLAVGAHASAAERPKTGLVLAGGGARGSAHVGVIKVMEELRIPVDLVVGTSMGSIVGGLYSSGLSPADMEEGFRTVDWEHAFTDSPDRKRISFRRKQDDFQALFPFEFGVGKRGVSRRSGVITGQKINFILSSMVVQTVGIDDFDQLKLPYRAVAADLQTGEAVILGKGDLAVAMRASMSVPGVFTPVVIDGRTLIDGGVAMNLPIEVAQQMGAERLIVVDVGTPPGTDVDSLSALGVVSQTFSVLAKRNVRESLTKLSDDDLLIVPELDRFSSSDFGRLLEGVEIGESAARAVEDQLRRFSVSQRDFNAYLASQRMEPQEPLPVDRVDVTGLTLTNPSFITRRLRSQPGQLLTWEDVNADLERISQLGEFATVDVRLVEDAEGRTLAFDAREKSWGPGYLRFGIDAESNFDGDSDFQAILNYRRANINRRGGEWKTIAGIGDPFSIETELFQPLDLGGIHWFVAPRLGYTRDKSKLFLPGGEYEVVDTDTSWAGLDLGVQFSNWGEIRVGVGVGSLDGTVDTQSRVPDFDFDLGGWRVRAVLDQLDNVFFPRQGNFWSLDGFFSEKSLNADRDYDRLSLTGLTAWTHGRGTVLWGTEFGTDLGSDIPFYDEFELGGFLNLSGLVRGELRGDVKALGSFGYYREVAKLGSLGDQLFVGGVAQAGQVWADKDSVELGELIYSGTLYFAINTKLTPIYVGWGLAEGGRREFYMFVGRPLK